MIKNIIHDEDFLKQPSAPATKEDIPTARDLIDTLAFHKGHCVGMAANMIGVLKNIIVINTGTETIAMLNPEIVKTSAKRYKTEEGCLSLNGERETERFESVEVKYRDLEWKKQKQKFSGFPAQIVQHEIDHCQGILI
ncbi:MAG: peptide deformylase [Schwartzia succinivorans]|uniref:peptide deformylase n=1 Tax=Schwartzia succinivorans TaxID=55507 RepID=UPI002356EF5D|nr:peptide deformylase [Schwartzia succinivorans]MBE6097845.1 peptide deformylase [Schwartzia succinivorans]